MPIQRLVVVGDAHLGAVPPSVEDALLAFLDAVATLGDGLLINGDLFGFWFTYRRAIPRTGLRVVVGLAELSRRVPILMTGGNHDRWGDPFWNRELGLEYAPHALRFKLGGTTAVAWHGDQVPETSTTSRIKHALFRSRLASSVYRLLPAELGFLATQSLARPAQSDRARRREKETARLQQSWAEAHLRADPALALLVMSHSHRPVAVELRPGQRYLNPGAWFDGYRYAIATPERLELNQFRA
ncbi:MAG: UDP-2,3-diacylglucosamine diphosphatase [Gemmatimonadales bacterium]